MTSGAAQQTVRIFPLGEVVLFPDTMLPLHIFEPRYRELLADAMATDRRIGMVLIRRPQAEAGQVSTGEPAIYPVGCVGTVVQHKPFEDGRSLVVLRGQTRFRVLEEVESDRGYRQVRAQTLHEAPAPPQDLRRWRDTLADTVRRLAAASGADVGEVDTLFERLDPATMVNYLAASLPVDVMEKQALLECATPEQRCRKLVEVLEFRIAQARLGIDGDNPRCN